MSNVKQDRCLDCGNAWHGDYWYTGSPCGPERRDRRPQPPKPPSKTPITTKAPNHRVDVVRADPANILDSARCRLCKKKYKKSDAVIRVRDLNHASVDAITVHRRCMEALLEGAVDDEDKEAEKFDAYRDEIADKYGIEKN